MQHPSLGVSAGSIHARDQVVDGREQGAFFGGRDPNQQVRVAKRHQNDTASQRLGQADLL